MWKLLCRNKVFVFFIVCCTIIAGCENDKYPGPPVPHTPIATTNLKSALTTAGTVSLTSALWNTADYFVVPLSSLSTNKVDTTDGVLNATGTYSGLAAFGDTAKLILRSVYNNDNIYILAEWQDISLDVMNKAWLFNGPKDPLKSDDSAQWTSQFNDDKLTLKFKFPQSQDYDEDIWMWSAGLTEPLGYAIDMVSKTDHTIINDIGTPMFVRNGTSDRSGPLYEFNGQTQTITRGNNSPGLLDAKYFLYNKIAYTGNPDAGYITYKGNCKECHGEKNNPSGYAGAPDLSLPWLNAMSRDAIKTFILDSEQHSDGYSHAASLTNSQLDNIFAWLRGQAGTPGYYLQTPNGSIADVVTTSNILTGNINPVNSHGYRVLFIRKLNTGNADDLIFDTTDGKTYTLGIELCNKDNLNFIGALNQTIVFKKNWNEN